MLSSSSVSPKLNESEPTLPGLRRLPSVGACHALRDTCGRGVAESIESYTLATAEEEDRSDDNDELVNTTKLVDERFEDIPGHLRR
ncbi:hypothetical protein FRC09_001363 [Ceratobasidium sp. 395]|nr:hypothetical protein FRC09_001363 [Ceratobasidium sp. 395]